MTTMRTKAMMKAAVLALALAAAGSSVASPAQDALRMENEILTAKLDTCAIIVRTIFVKIRAKRPIEKEDDVAGCVADGKAQTKVSLDALRAAAGGKARQEIADWRVEWMTAFDAAAPQESDIERVYLQRQSQSKGAISRASNKLEAALD